MSSSLFPSLPGVDVSVQRGSRYQTDVLTTWNGKEVRLARRTSAVVSVKLKVNFLRDNVNAPSPWAVSELAMLKSFHVSMLGQFDTFLIADPDGGSNITVRFASDELGLTQIVPHVWAGEISLVTVL